MACSTSKAEHQAAITCSRRNSDQPLLCDRYGLNVLLFLWRYHAYVSTLLTPAAAVVLIQLEAQRWTAYVSSLTSHIDIIESSLLEFGFGIFQAVKDGRMPASALRPGTDLPMTAVLTMLDYVAEKGVSSTNHPSPASITKDWMAPSVMRTPTPSSARLRRSVDLLPGLHTRIPFLCAYQPVGIGQCE